MKKYLLKAVAAVVLFNSFGTVLCADSTHGDTSQKNVTEFILEEKADQETQDEIDYKQLIRNLDKKLIWKMVIDRRYHSKGKYICDTGGKISKGLSASKEPGYLKAMTNAFKYMVSTIDNKKMDENLFREFHKRALTKVGIKYYVTKWGEL